MTPVFLATSYELQATGSQLLASLEQLLGAALGAAPHPFVTCGDISPHRGITPTLRNIIG